MRIESIDWDDATVVHIARHGVEPAEVEDALFEHTPRVFRTKRNRYIALGQIAGGRHLSIVFEYLGQQKAKIITARAMSGSERKLYRRR